MDIVTVETLFDSYLNVHTRSEAGDDAKERASDNIYEATSYFYLERLFRAFPFEEGDHLIDFGCGKGRVLFMASLYSCGHVTGVENNEKRFSALGENVRSYQQKHGARTRFDIRNCDAQSAVIGDTANKFFFFEPFNTSVYAHVVRNILKSLERRPRDAAIILYLPEERTIKYLDTIGEFQKEVSVGSALYYLGEELITVPNTVFYANYSMGNAIDPNLLAY